MMGDTGVILLLAGLAIGVTIIQSFLKQAGRDEFAYLVLVVGLTIGLIKIIPVILNLFQQVKTVFNLY
ncbi:SpoIIIAC/SpoIIIAD family protein [Dehalobacterium formicoaceticum]|uniref:Stage III sporulation protein AC n=1 Tax=Dehalobacterium formicoaceticum TaxID=51515 RepID=A0ABT1Y600_9FIRM|nr:SpoIIIAC/SpoIIIAD family protein [Dehalobacterium formicoaceticum]MCR6545963.1 stage III sporulation protein AC [Dehalobacterium formicoaceticum]